MIPRIGDVDVASGINGDAVRLIELPVARSIATPLRDENTVRCELLDSVVASIGDVNVTFGVEGDTAGPTELPISASPFRPAPSTDKSRRNQ